jgi:5-carboxymethyl-2-hydroxymuconate isomerase
MPHCIVEYSTGLTAQLAPTRLINAVFQGALQSELFDSNDIKTRIIAYQDYHSGVVKSEFIHVIIRLLSGRTIEQRAALTHRVLAALFDLGLSGVSLTVEAVEIENASYAKRVID